MIREQAIDDHVAATSHTVRADAGRAQCQHCTWIYPPIGDPTDPPPTDPAPAMGPAPEADPGPEPTEPPPTPPLTLKQRIENAVERAMNDQRAEMTAGLFGKIVRDVHAEVSAGADWTPREEATEMTAAQALAYLLDLPEWSRIERLGLLLEQASKAARCWEHDHDGAIQQLRALTQQANRWHDALLQIARLCSTVDQPISGEENVIGSIATAALVTDS